MEFALAIGGFLAGGAFGSFFSASALAWMENRPVFVKRSVCSHCGKTLSPAQLVPIFSFIALGGKCGYCGARIPVFHFFIEFLSAILCALFAVTHGPQWLTLLYMPVCAALVTAAAIDIKTHLLPDFITLGCLAFLPFIVFFNARLTMIDALAGYIAGGGIPLLMHFIFRWVRKKDCLGFGDIKLFALGGALAGWQSLPFIFFFSSVCGILAFLSICLHDRTSDLWNRELPFGPFICSAVILVLLMPQLPGMAYNLLTLR